MKLALIPPIDFLDYLELTKYQLMLPHLSGEKYRTAYGKLALNDDQHIILDNGVAEGMDVPFRDIVKLAKITGVDEIVLPDVIADAKMTAAKAEAAARQARHSWTGDFVYVLQGKTIEEVLWSADHALQYPRVSVLALPRHLITTIGQSTIRWQLADMIVDNYKRDMLGRSIHFLGMNSSAPHELEIRPRKMNPFIRGIDTSAPFNYAYANEWMENGAKIDRPRDYFDLREVFFSKQALHRNIQYLMGQL